MDDALSLSLAFKAMHEFLRREDVRDAVLALIRLGPLPWEGENRGYWERLEAYGWAERGWGEGGEPVALLSSHLSEVLGALAGTSSLGPVEVEERIRAEAQVLNNLFRRTREALVSKGRAEAEGALRDLEGVIKGQMRLKALIEGMLRSWRRELAELEVSEGEALWERIEYLDRIGRAWHVRLDGVLSVLSALSQESLGEGSLQIPPKAMGLWLLVQRGFIQLYGALQSVQRVVSADLDLEGGLRERLKRLETARKRVRTSLQIFQLLDSEELGVPPLLAPVPHAPLLTDPSREEAASLGEAIREFFAPFPEEEEEEGVFLPPPEEAPEEDLRLFLESFAQSPSASLVRYIHETDGWSFLSSALATLYLYPEVAGEVGLASLRFVLEEGPHGLVLWDVLKGEEEREGAAGGSPQA